MGDEEKIMISVEKLIEMKNADIHSIDKNDLVDISKVKVKTNLSKEKRILDYIKQIKNPYCFLCDGVKVKVSFIETEATLESNLENFLNTL